MASTSTSVFQTALQLFQAALARAHETSLKEPAAATLATVDENQRPAARIVLIRGFDERGFMFFTNSESRKGRELARNPQAALCFFWDPLHEQVRVEGKVEVTSTEDSDSYWATRPRESQIAAWASQQSRPLASRETLAACVELWQKEFAGRDVPRPIHWHGYRLIPDRIEFWKGLPARLHDRVVFEKSEGGWQTFLLNP